MGDMNASGIFPCGNNETVREDVFQLSNLGYIISEGLLGVFIGFGNVLVLLAFCKFKELRTSLNVYIVALALADLSVALIAIPIHISVFVFPVLKNVFFICMLRDTSIVISGGSSALLLIVISIDRYLAIEQPLKYFRIITTGKAKLISSGVLLYQFSLCSIPFLGWNNWSPCRDCTSTLILPRMYITWIVVTPLIGSAFIAFINITIFVTANKASAGIRAGIVTFSGETSVMKKKDVIQNKTAMKTLMLMFMAYAVCFLPIGVHTLWEIYAQHEPGHQTNDALRAGTGWLAFMNSGLNPLIYHRRIPEFNTAFRRLIGLKANSRRHTNKPLDTLATGHHLNSESTIS